MKMDKIMIDGVVVEPLREIDNELGAVLHMMHCDSKLFHQFGEIYFSEVIPGAVKAWKRHQRMTQHFAVPIGIIELVLFDDRQASTSRGQLMHLTVGRPGHYHLVRIPPLIWYGFRSVNNTTALIANYTDLKHDPEESERIESDDARIPYQWPNRDGILP